MPAHHLTLATANGRSVAVTRTGVQIGLLHGADARLACNDPQASARREERTAVSEWQRAVDGCVVSLRRVHQIANAPLTPPRPPRAERLRRRHVAMTGFTAGLALASFAALVLGSCA